MAKDRLTDTFAYLNTLNARQGAGLKLAQIARFENKVRANDLTNRGAYLSLNWNRYDDARPSENARHAMRAYLMSCIYLGTVVGNQAHATAVLQKARSEAWLLTKTGENIRTLLDTAVITTAAVEYRLNAGGHHAQRATGTAAVSQLRVPDEMRRRVAQGTVVGVLLIDMMTNNDNAAHDVGEHVTYDGETVLGYMKEVLKTARALDLFVYDVVIDKTVPPDEGRHGGWRTIQPLRNLMPGGEKHRPFAKHFYNCFQGTELEQMLQDHHVTTVVVMGFHANMCVCNTIFGTPEAMESRGERPATEEEARDFMQKNPLYQRHQVPNIVDRQMRAYIGGLLDRGYTVLTSRCILASQATPLPHEYAGLAGR